MKFLISGFKQETNTFSPVPCDMECFRYTTYEGQRLMDLLADENTEIGGMLQGVRERADEAVTAVMMRAQSGGRVEHSVADWFLEKTLAVFDREQPDAILLAMHGGMAIDHDIDDGTGYIYHRIRDHVGKDVVIAASQDMHSNITRQNLRDVNAIAGMHTFPHSDMREIGLRAARMAYRILDREPFHFACVKIPMIVPAESYSSDSGIFKELLDEAAEMVRQEEILDFSIFQMQPWLNVREAGNAVTVAARTADAAVVHAKKIARKLFDLRKQMQIHLYPIDEVIDLAAANKTGTPVILVDSADSPGAGSCGDSSAVLERLLERETDLHCALCIADPRAAEHAFEVGVGNEGIFELGGTLDPTFQKTIRVKARVHLLHEGLYRNEGPAYRFIPVDSGRSAVLRIRNIDVVVVHRISYPYDVQLFRAFGVDPAMYDLVAVKSANQYKLGYGKLTSLFCPADTPGSSTADLTSLPFDRIPRPFYPFDDIEDFDDTPVSVS